MLSYGGPPSQASVGELYVQGVERQRGGEPFCTGKGAGHKVQYIYTVPIEYHSVCPLVGIGSFWDPVQPISGKQVCTPPPPGPKGGRLHNRLRMRGWGSPNSDDLRSVYMWGGCHTTTQKLWYSIYYVLPLRLFRSTLLPWFRPTFGHG